MLFKNFIFLYNILNYCFIINYFTILILWTFRRHHFPLLVQVTQYHKLLVGCLLTILGRKDKIMNGTFPTELELFSLGNRYLSKSKQKYYN